MIRSPLRVPVSLLALALAALAPLTSCSDDPGNESDAGTSDGRTDGPPGVDAIDAPTELATITIERTGAGTGTIRSSPAGVDCGTTCTATFPVGSVVALIATPEGGSGFSGWSGPCTGTAACVFTVGGDVTVTAGFDVARYAVTVTRTGNGGGTVTSAPTGIDCPGTCSTTYTHGTELTLTAAAAPSSTFLGWSGAGCTGTGPCTITVTGVTNVTAAFAVDQTLVVTKTGFGSGTVTSNPAGIDCGTDCDHVYPGNAMVTLTAAASADSIFAGWTGGGCSGVGPCTVTVNNAVMVSAQFDLRQFTLLVARTGTGTGFVGSLPAGISCGADCSQPYTSGTMVTLTATPTGPSTFTGWSGGGCSGTGPCTVTITAATNVTATFTINSYPLTVVRGGTGMGTVTSAPAGIDCGTDCTETYPATSLVMLTATPAVGSTFTGWSGGGCTGTGGCSVTIGAATMVTANFSVAPFTLTVVKAGAGVGTVTSTPAGINCGTDCTQDYGGGTIVTLTAAPSSISTFDGWSGAGCSGTGTCMVTMTAAATVTATFSRNSYTLTVAKAGVGGGVVTSSPSGIDCGTDCSELYVGGTPVMLTAIPDATSTFAGWSGGGCSGTGACTTTVNAATTVTATFAVSQFRLTVTKSGNGIGTVTSVPAGISCGTDCTQDYAVGTMVTLSAAGNASSSFAGWTGGGCTGLGQCTVTMDQVHTIDAAFTANSYPLNVVIAPTGTGTGSVASMPAGIDCGADCTETYVAGTVVSLVPTVGPNSVFAGWTGGCSGTGACNVTISAATTVTATFNLVANTLTVSRDGNGTGTVSSSPTGVSCGSDCTQAYPFGTVVTLTAAPAANSSFAGWTGGGCSGTGPCMVTMNASLNVNATFTLNSYPLTVVKAGAGVGTVTSNPPGIDCGTDCSEVYLATTPVVLTAIAGANSTFTGWSGATGCSTAAMCTVTIAAAQTVTATFAVTQVTLNVTRSGNGTGTVTSSPTGISCGSDCTQNYDVNTVVTLTAAPAANSSFAGWSGGGCSGTGPCMVTVAALTTVNAVFALNTYPLSVVRAGAGSGTVTSNPPGIDCGTDCTEDYLATTPVVLTAIAGANSTFTGWTGATGCSTAAMCTVTIAAAQTVTATFGITQVTLNVTRSGNGTGTVTSAPTGISCGTDCTQNYDVNTVVTLTAAPAANSSFAGWSGGGCSGTGPCMVTVAALTTVNAAFTLNSYPLSVVRAGTGSGSVTSNPPGIDCGTDCTETYLATTPIVLTAAVGPNSTFAGWSGGGCTGTALTCTVTIQAATTVTATFNVATHVLTITRLGGNGTGTITSNPAGINCGSDCTEPYAFNTMVTLNAAAGATSTFTGWSGGGCSGTGPCTVTMTAATTVNATFTLNDYTVTVSRIGAGTGSVSSNPAGIDCGTDCSETWTAGTIVTLTATAGPNSVFSGWSGGGCSGTAPCNHTVGSTVTITANFTVQVHQLSVTRNGTGAGTVTSVPAGINCGTDCTENYASATSVTLSAAPAVGSVFTGWSGGGCSGTGTCVVSITSPTTVTATFALLTFSLDVTLAGAGTGTVTSSPPGIACAGDCSETYNYNTTVTLTAAPAAGSTFTGWTGACTGTAPMCVLSMTAARTTTATFN